MRLARARVPVPAPTPKIPSTPPRLVPRSPPPRRLPRVADPSASPSRASPTSRRYRDASMAREFAGELAELDRLDEEARALAATTASASSIDLPPPAGAGAANAPPPASNPDASDAAALWARDNRMMNEIGRSLWKNGNARYDPGTMNIQAHYKDDFEYDPDEIEPVDKTHFRRRDTFTNYVEAAAKMKNIAMSA